MVCFHPLKGFRGVGGGVVFDARKGGLPLSLPCGQCRGCRAERARAWALRCVHEAQMHKRNSFITLTYDNENLPSDGGLRVEDWQKFAKRLRKRIGSFRFFHCGEYGEVNKRPHYHACIFGHDFSEDRVLLRRDERSSLYVSPLLTETWGLGHTVVGDLTFDSAAYVARYCMKKVTGLLADEYYTRVDPATGECVRIASPYVTMSRGGRGGLGGIGTRWFEKFGREVYPADEVIHAGRRFRPPRFYDGKLSEEELESVKVKRRERVNKRKDDLTPERLAVREQCAAARLSSLRRSL